MVIQYSDLSFFSPVPHFPPLPETIDAHANIINIQTHVRVKFGKEKDKYIDERGQEPDNPHRPMLKNFQYQVYNPRHNAQIF